jgi:CRISPR-associated protein Cas6
MTFELSFPLRGDAPPHDHGYFLYSALCRQSKWLHETKSKVLVGPIGGLGPRYGGKLPPKRARLRLRVAAEHLSEILDWAGSEITVDRAMIQLGAPEIRKLTPQASLQARMVTIKGFEEVDSFFDAAVRQLKERNIQGLLHVLPSPANGSPWRRVIRIHDKTIVGFSVAVTQLEAEESLVLQEEGLGGRGKMGCGFFVPLAQ